MNKLSLSILALATAGRLAFAADVQSLKCERDSRPVDGPYNAVELVKNTDGKYDVFYHSISPGFGSPVVNTRVKIAQNLSACAFAVEDSRLVTCHKSSLEEKETSNSGFSTKLVTETQVIDTKGSTRTASYLDVTAYSPILLNGQPGQGLPHMERKGRFNSRFSGTGSHGIMLNRCTVN